MSVKPIRWERDKAQYSSAENAMIEHICIGYVFYDSMTSRDQKDKYMAHFNLGGYKQPKEHFQTEDLAKEWMERIFRMWILKITE